MTFTFSFKTLRYFSSGAWPLCSSTRLLRPSLLNLNFLELTSYQQYVLLHRHNISVHLNSSLKRPGPLLSCCLCFTLPFRGEEICYSIGSESINTAIWTQPLPFRSHFRSYTIFQFFLGKSKVQQICLHFQLFELVYITESGEEVVL